MKIIRIWHSASFFQKLILSLQDWHVWQNLSQKLHSSRLGFTIVVEEREQKMYEWFKLWIEMVVTFPNWLLSLCCRHVIPGSQANTYFSFLCIINLHQQHGAVLFRYGKTIGEETYTTIPRAYKNLIYIPVWIIITFHLMCTKNVF